jgi:hypothetical protein
MQFAVKTISRNMDTLAYIANSNVFFDISRYSWSEIFCKGVSLIA